MDRSVTTFHLTCAVCGVAPPVNNSWQYTGDGKGGLVVLCMACDRARRGAPKAPAVKVEAAEVGAGELFGPRK